MRSVRAELCGLALLALTTPVGAENWVVQIPIRAADGNEVMLPLTLATQTGVKTQDLATGTQISENHSRDLFNSAWSLFPQTDASQRIVFMKRGAQFWTVQHAGDD